MQTGSAGPCRQREGLTGLLGSAFLWHVIYFGVLCRALNTLICSTSIALGCFSHNTVGKEFDSDVVVNIDIMYENKIPKTWVTCLVWIEVNTSIIEQKRLLHRCVLHRHVIASWRITSVGVFISLIACGKKLFQCLVDLICSCCWRLLECKYAVALVWGVGDDDFCLFFHYTLQW